MIDYGFEEDSVRTKLKNSGPDRFENPWTRSNFDERNSFSLRLGYGYRR